MTSKHDAHYKLRDDEIFKRLRNDVLGPAGGDGEVLTDDQPVTAYLTGVLFPQQQDRQADEDISEENDGIDEQRLLRRTVDDAGDAIDTGVALASRRRPSSMGITFAVDPNVAPTLTVTIEAACYVPEDSAGNVITPERAEARTTDEQREQWRHERLSLPEVPLDATRQGSSTLLVVPAGLELRAFVRQPSEDGTVTVTVSLVNTHQVNGYGLQDEFCFFQPSIEVRGPSGTKPIVERRAVEAAVDDELALSRLLYRHAPIFAAGHGCAAEWDWTPAAPGKAVEPRSNRVASVRTTFVPSVEVLLTDANPSIPDEALAMGDLGTKPVGEVLAVLDDLLDRYGTWIEERRKEAEAFIDPDEVRTAAEQIRACDEALARMRSGLRRLESDPAVFQAFQLANRAMASQRAQADWARSGRVGKPEETGRWRPFQIAFILQCLDGIADDGHSDRDIADLLWFPTGGGKTEAYLGLIAFTTFLRRLRDPRHGGGVTAIMRYTLRLLTLQQFQRAATLICAMEVLRGDNPESLGAERISIGMWVGASATPNHLKDAQESLQTLAKGGKVSEKNPVQLHSCPWCGLRMDHNNYEVDMSNTQMIVRCAGPTCRFHDGLPVHLVDETVYNWYPTLVIATVDKFAAIAWRAQTAALFNRDRRYETKPPELIVQDELHLISGPLGTLTGLYETAIDLAADHPKVIASTATIRRAGDQGKHLFNRAVRQFPPAGLDARDSWFAVESPREAKATRRYVGLMAPSTSQATLLIRAYAALLHAARTSMADDGVRDAYWTLVGYFNSLRILAAAELQVNDDVQDRLEFIGEREGTTPHRVELQSELTSRADASEVPQRLKDLEVGLPDSALDVMLATNMISVGVDVERLGLMAVMGQPQTTAEYIQATSRVGRKYPGLVVTLLNANRSRDRSHYEDFLGFHSALYREVESTSVTPFSARSRDRGLHAVLIALVRLMAPIARANDAAAAIESFHADVLLVKERILARVRDVDDAEYDHTERALDEVIEWWRERAAEEPSLVYAADDRHPIALLGDYDAPEELERLATLWSLRDVDAESALYLRKS